MADTNKFVEFENYVFRDEQGKPIVTVGNISDKTTQSFTFSSALKDKDGAIVAGEIIMGIKTSQGKTENIFLPASSSTDGINFSNVVRGIKINGMELASGIPIGDSAFALDDIPEGAVVENVFHPIQLQMLYAVIKGQIASGGTAWRVGNKVDEDIYFYADNASANAPNFRYKNSLSRWEWSDDGLSWTGFGSAGTHGTTANISDHADVNSTVSSAMADGDILYANSGKLQRLEKGFDNRVLRLVGGLPAWTTVYEAAEGAYGVSWSNNVKAPTKKAVYDEMEKKSNGMTGWSATTYSEGAVYQASTDLIVIGNGVAGGSHYPLVAMYSDSSSSPTTLRAKTGGNNGDYYKSGTMPVKKGDYWKVVNEGSSSASVTIQVMELS